MCRDRRGPRQGHSAPSRGPDGPGLHGSPASRPTRWELDDRVARCRSPERSATAGPTRRPGPACLVVLPLMTYLAIVSGSGHPVPPVSGRHRRPRAWQFTAWPDGVHGSRGPSYERRWRRRWRPIRPRATSSQRASGSSRRSASSIRSVLRSTRAPTWDESAPRIRTPQRSWPRCRRRLLASAG